MQPIKATRPLLLLLIAIGITTCVIAAADGDGNENKLKIIKGELSPTSLYKNEPIEYDLELTLRDGFASISGRTKVLFKFASQEKSNCRKVKEKLIDHLGGDKPKVDSIHLYLSPQVKITDAKLEVAKSLEDLEQPDGERQQIKVEGVTVNHSDQRFSVNVGTKLSVYKYGRLEVAYETSPEAVQEYQTADRSKYQARSLAGRDSIRRLMPYFGYLFSTSKIRATIMQPDLDSVVLSNLHKLGDTTIVMDAAGQKHYMKSEFYQTTPIAVDKIEFALGPFSNLAQRDSSKDPIISAPRVFVPPQGFALDFQARASSWLKNWFESMPSCKNLRLAREEDFRYDPDIWREKELQLERNYLFKYTLLEVPKGASPSEANIETALNVALAMAGKHFRKLSVYFFDYWIRDGLAAHYAIRMVRELEPSLNVDDYVRSHLIPMALEHEMEGKFNEMAASYDFSTKTDPREAKTILLWHIKCAAIWDLIKRNFSPDQAAFDWSARRILFAAESNSDHIEPVSASFEEHGTDGYDIDQFIKSWTNGVGYPLVAMTLDKKNRGIKFVQAPIDWLDNKNDQIVRADVNWPLSIKMNFSNSDGTLFTSYTVEGFNGYLGYIRLVSLPDWFDLADPKHKISFDILDQEELPYYRMSFSPDFMELMRENTM